MDPQTAWTNLLDACSAGDCEAIEDAAAALMAWLDSGGFPPETIERRVMGPRWNRAVAYTACLAALTQCCQKKG
jgi:hypothetical protein